MRGFETNQPTPNSVALWLAITLALTGDGNARTSAAASAGDSASKMGLSTADPIRYGALLRLKLELADAALSKRDAQTAQRALAEGVALLDSLGESMPRFTVVERIGAATRALAAGDPDSFYDALPAIYADLVVLEDLDPEATEEAHDRLEAVERHVRAGRQAIAELALEELSEDLEELVPSLPVEYASSQLYAALAALLDQPTDIDAAHHAVEIALDALALRVDCVCSISDRALSPPGRIA